MWKKLLVVMIAAVLGVTAFAQEPAGRVDAEDMRGDSLSVSGIPGVGLMPHTDFLSRFRPEAPGFSSALRRYGSKVSDTLPELRLDNRWMWVKIQPDVFPGTHSPYAYDFSKGGMITSWKGGAVVGASSRTTMPGLMSGYNASATAVQNVGNFTFTAGLSADRWLLWRGTRTSVGVSGSMSYNFSDNVSVTLFGRYYSNSSFQSMAAMPYFGSSGYGGYFTLMGETFGADLGVERYYDSFARRWVTSPIITPKVKFSEKFTLELPVGWLVKELLDDAFKSKRSNGPMIMPEVGPMPGQIPFGPPEMPR